jgi:hypothetical protein
VFPLELFNGPHPRRGTDTEAVGLGQIEPDAKFRVWADADDLYPHTVLLTAEAVHAASAQNLRAGEELDLALPRAFWTHSRSISHRQVILDIAGQLPAGTVDVTVLTDALDSGRHRADVTTDYAVARTDAVAGSPTFPTGPPPPTPASRCTGTGPGLTDSPWWTPTTPPSTTTFSSAPRGDRRRCLKLQPRLVIVRREIERTAGERSGHVSNSY